METTEAKYCNSSFISLKTKPFPQAFENTFQAMPKYLNHSHQEKILLNEKDRRNSYDTNECTLYSRIGQIRMIYKGIKSSYVGTGTVFYCNPLSQRVYAITCAHNLIHYDPTEDIIHSTEYIWFDRRITNNWKIYSDSKSIKKYKIDKMWIHPNHNPKDQICPYDLALISFIEDDNYFTNNQIKMNEAKTFVGYQYSRWLKRGASHSGINKHPTLSLAIGQITGGAICGGLIPSPKGPKISLPNYTTKEIAIYGAIGFIAFQFAAATAGSLLGLTVTSIGGAIPDSHRFEGVSLFGYPGEKRGELWGEQFLKSDDKTLIVTDFKNGKMIKHNIHTTGGQSGSAIMTSAGAEYKIIGIHIGGNALDTNWAINMSPDNIKWIKKCVQEIEGINSLNILSVF